MSGANGTKECEYRKIYPVRYALASAVHTVFLSYASELSVTYA